MTGRSEKEGKVLPGDPRHEDRDVLLAEIDRPYSTRIRLDLFLPGAGPIIVVDNVFALTYSKMKGKGIVVIDRKIKLPIAFETRKGIGTTKYQPRPTVFKGDENEIKGIIFYVRDRKGDHGTHCYVGERYRIRAIDDSPQDFVAEISSTAPIRARVGRTRISPRDLLRGLQAKSAQGN